MRAEAEESLKEIQESKKSLQAKSKEIITALKEQVEELTATKVTFPFPSGCFASCSILNGMEECIYLNFCLACIAERDIGIISCGVRRAGPWLRPFVPSAIVLYSQ